MKSQSPDDDQLAAWYRANVADAPLPDDGFTRNVLAALPTPARSARAHVSPRGVAVLLGTAAGTVLAAFKFFTAAPTEFGWPPISSGEAAALAQLGNPMLHTALGVTVATLAFAFWREILAKLHKL